MTSVYAPLESVGISMVFQAAALAAILLGGAALSIKSKLASEGGGILPDEGVTLRNLIEVIVIQLADLSRDIMGEDWRSHFPLIGTIFFFVLVSNLMGLVPGVGGSTSDVNTTAAWAIISFVYYNYVGIRIHGFKYIYQFMGPALMNVKIGGTTYHVRPLTPFFLPLEIVLHLARILTLAVRLLANMYADHQVVAVWISLVPFAIPAVFMGLGLMVCFLQAVVFALLTMIYIGSASQEPH
ncbi:MAG: F0F1 ATP synthase subunit A [Myxococcales bacterium]|nr:F0F1 ATP synthase subunit A [Myxococcales bacterium]MCH7867879.1 F0F1 ATP synthase subunit A [Myxococcales bacterium]